ncbi:hypothetical protein Tco_1377643 [Tanacetum coccineum]
MDIDIKEDENELELTYPYEEVDPLNPPPPASESEPEDVIEVEDTVVPEDETVLASIYEVGESSTATIPQEDGDSLLSGFMRRDIDSLFDLGNEVHSSVEEGTTTMKNLVEKLTHEFYREMIRRGFVFEERPNEAIDVPVEYEKSPSSEPRGSPLDS